MSKEKKAVRVSAVIGALGLMTKIKLPSATSVSGSRPNGSSYMCLPAGTKLTIEHHNRVTVACSVRELPWGDCSDEQLKQLFHDTVHVNVPMDTIVTTKHKK